MFPYQGGTALITGASSGIGAEFAKGLAARGMNVVLTARSAEKLQSLATELADRYHVQTHTIAADLSHDDAVEEIALFVAQRNLTIDLLVNNAGLLSHGKFEKTDPQREREEVLVNIAAVVALTHKFLPGMLERQQGGVINLSSVAAFQPIPYMAVYAATKAFVLSFSVALWEECRQRNVCVLALCPGTTTTNLFSSAAAPVPTISRPRTTEQVVATALRGLDKRRSIIVDGLQNTLLTHGTRLVPRWYAAKCAAATVRPAK